MKLMKWPLLINQILCFLIDFQFTTLSTPYLFFHHLGYLGLGLLNLFNFSQQTQFIIGVATVYLTASSYIYLFETRSSSLQTNRFRMSRTWVKSVYHVICLIISSYILPVLFIAPVDQVGAKLESLTFDPCPTKEYFENDIFIVSTDPNIIRYFVWIYVPTFLLHFIAHLSFHMSCTVYYLYIVPAKTASQGTRKNQQKFFIGIVFQTSIPLLIFLSILIILGIFDGTTRNLTQQMMNMVTISYSTHGLVQSVAVLVVHRAYRQAVWRMVLRKKRETELV